MASDTKTLRRSWLDAEIELSEARMRALSDAALHVENLIPWLDNIERQGARAFLDLVRLRKRREETLRQQHEQMLREADADG